MKKNKKSIFLVSSILGGTALISVGFATWLITTTPDPLVLDGSIVVETVAEKNIAFVKDDFTWTDTGDDDGDDTNDSKIIFGGKEAAAGAWLTNDANAEHLSTTLTIVVDNYEELDEVTATIEASNATKWQEAVTANYVAAMPTLDSIPASSFTKVGETTTGQANLTITFAWGSAFGGQNPIDYYAAKGESFASEAKSRLEALYTSLNGLTYNLTLTATAK